jgi:hypothetical protein
MKTYAEFVEVFQRKIDRLGEHPFALSYREVVGLMAQPVATQAGDEACRVFATELRWPPVGDHVRLELCMRLDSAREWCEICAEGEIDPEETGTIFLTELLIDYYRDAGKENWIVDRFLPLWKKHKQNA